MSDLGAWSCTACGAIRCGRGRDTATCRRCGQVAQLANSMPVTAPRRPGLTDEDVAAMRAARNPAHDVAPGDEDHEEFATVVDGLDIAHLPPFPWWGV